jgi:hypothetical protein
MQSKVLTLHKQLTLKNIRKYGHGFNIEGLSLGLKKLPEQKFFYICMPLDRPFVNGITLGNLTKDNPYILKEFFFLRVKKKNRILF